MENGSIVSTSRSVQVFGPALATDVVEVGAITRLSRVFCQFIVPLDYWQLDEGVTAATNLVDPGLETIELAFLQHHVVDARFEQDIRASGLLLNYMVFTVGAPATGAPGGGLLTDELRVEVDQMTDRSLRAGLVFDPLDRLYERLATLART